MCDKQEQNTQNECGYTHEQYLEDRKTYLNGYQDQQTLFDKTLITLSAGAVGLIFTVTKGNIESISLKYAVIFFVLAVISTMISFLCSANTFRSYHHQFEENYRNDEIDKVLSSRWDKAVSVSNYISVTFASVGTISLLYSLLLHT